MIVMKGCLWRVTFLMWLLPVEWGMIGASSASSSSGSGSGSGSNLPYNSNRQYNVPQDGYSSGGPDRPPPPPPPPPPPSFHPEGNDDPPSQKRPPNEPFDEWQPADPPTSATSITDPYDMDFNVDVDNNSVEPSSWRDEKSEQDYYNNKDSVEPPPEQQQQQQQQRRRRSIQEEEEEEDTEHTQQQMSTPAAYATATGVRSAHAAASVRPRTTRETVEPLSPSSRGFFPWGKKQKQSPPYEATMGSPRPINQPLPPTTASQSWRSTPPNEYESRETSSRSSSSNSFTAEDEGLTPIHYKFHSTKQLPKYTKTEELALEDDNDDNGRIPKTASIDEELLLDHDKNKDERGARRRTRAEEEEFASPRQDVITVYMSRQRGTIKVVVSAGMVGMALGALIGRSTLDRAQPMATAVAVVLAFLTLVRNPYGDLARALGMTFILTLSRTSNIKREYATWPHLKSMLGAGPRCPFPPIMRNNDNPWQYEPEYESDPEFKMAFSLVAMALVGMVCGSNVQLPLVPSWLGGMVGASSFAYWTTIRKARGDLARAMGMRVVSVGQEVLTINTELRLVRTTGVVVGKIVDKMLILDRKHNIKDRAIAAGQWAYTTLSRTAAGVQANMNTSSRSQPPPSPRRRADNDMDNEYATNNGDRAPPPPRRPYYDNGPRRGPPPLRRNAADDVVDDRYKGPPRRDYKEEDDDDRGNGRPPPRHWDRDNDMDPRSRR